ncbi:hypothetical protein [Streptomyces sp. NPDC097619]|uniref:hypothetical protein n=1 Tax=Streptomyces sp. NPDC097619 TaxID=3157228 RepID=UPI00332AC716
MARRLVAGLAALLLFGEALGFVLVNHVLGTVARRQSMSIAGTNPDLMVTGTYVLGAVMGVFLACCAVVLALTGLRDRAPGRAARILLIVCVVVHVVLGALAVGLVGWGGFAFMALVLTLLMLSLTLYGKAPRGKAGAPVPGTP